MTPTGSPVPLAPGSISLRLYPHNELGATEIAEELCAQAALAATSGFDGVMTSEHHGGFSGYLPNPQQAAGWCLDAMDAGWAAACPLLLPLRPAALVAEEAAWLAARYPGRVGLGVAAGALPLDFELFDTDQEDLSRRFAEALERLAAWLGGRADDDLVGDSAIALCAERPVPLVTAAMSPAAVRRAARLGVGILLDSLSTAERCRVLTDEYRAAGGEGTCILIRRIWLGPPPSDRVDQQIDVYRGYASESASRQWTSDEMLTADDPAAVADMAGSVVDRAGVDALNLRVHVEGSPPPRRASRSPRSARRSRSCAPPSRTAL